MEQKCQDYIQTYDKKVKKEMLFKDILTKPPTFIFYQHPLFRRMIARHSFWLKPSSNYNLTLCVSFYTIYRSRKRRQTMEHSTLGRSMKHLKSTIILTMKTMQKSQKANILGLLIQFWPRANGTKMLNRAIKKINPTF